MKNNKGELNMLSLQPNSNKVDNPYPKKDTIDNAEDFRRSNTITKSSNYQNNGANCQKKPRSNSKHRLNIFHSSHNKLLLCTFLRMSPISIMIDVGKQIIERRKRGVNQMQTEPYSVKIDNV